MDGGLTGAVSACGGLVSGLLALLLLAPLPAAAQEETAAGRSLHWREIAVEARLNADGRLHVRERQAMVFDGAWNGGQREFDTRIGQELRLHELVRIDPGSGARIALVRGDLADVDEFDWSDGETLRWRSRLDSDPPFRDREIVYELTYTLWPVLERSAGGVSEYLLRHDFAFPDRVGVIDRFSVDLTLDSAWAGPDGARIQEVGDRLPPGRGYTVRVPLRYVGPGEPAAVSAGASAWLRAVVAVGALLVPLLVLVGLRRRARELDRVAPLTPPDAISEEWLRAHIFRYPAEVVGAAWDGSVAEAEVAALLARLVEEGKLTSRVEAGDGAPVLHLRRVAPLSDFESHERALLEGLFFDGGDSADTKAVREHYEDEGFDPASIVRKALTARIDELPGAGRVRREWLLPAVVIVAGIVTAVAVPGPPGSRLVAVLGLLIGGVTALFTLPFAVLLARRVTHRTGLEAGVLLTLLCAAVPLAMLSSGVVEKDAGLVFHLPGSALLLGHLVVLAGLGMMAIALARPTETPERLAFRRRLVSAREFFESELRRPRPRLRDEWFPYLLAFGLGPHIDSWFRAFSPQASASTAATAATAVAAGSRSAATAGSGWSGGGPRFGGGSWGGGGAGGTWGVAAAGMAAGVSAPGSSGGSGSGGGGGGGSSSGGGGGGGW